MLRSWRCRENGSDLGTAESAGDVLITKARYTELDVVHGMTRYKRQGQPVLPFSLTKLITKKSQLAANLLGGGTLVAPTASCFLTTQPWK